MTTLSPFQEKCSDELKKVLRHIGHNIRTWNIVKGREETYIEVNLDRVKIWIYEDGACWQGVGRNRVFEAVDYDSLDDLQRAFLAEISVALSKKADGCD